MNLVFLGPPGAGKGTVAQFLEKEFSLKQLSTGDLLRNEVKNRTDLGLKAKEFMDKGLLVPDELVAKILVNSFNEKEKGIVLDGFPRNLNQARILDGLLEKKKMKITAVLNVLAEEKTIIERISSRRQCFNCGEIYGKDKKPKKAGVCDSCGGKLIQRPDDREEVVKNRLKVYYENNKGLPEYYKKKGLLKEIDGNKKIGEVLAQAKKLLKR